MGIKNYIQDVLGCHCQEEVFENVKYYDNYITSDRQSVIKFVIGDRLLIYLLKEPPRKSDMEYVKSLIIKGARERDQGQLNRFRIVLPKTFMSAKDIVTLENYVCQQNLGKVHIHLESIEDLLESIY